MTEQRQLDPFARMIEAEEAYRAELVREYGEEAQEARDDPARCEATPRLFELRTAARGAVIAYYGSDRAPLAGELVDG